MFYQLKAAVKPVFQPKKLVKVSLLMPRQAQAFVYLFHVSSTFCPRLRAQAVARGPPSLPAIKNAGIQILNKIF